MSKDDVFFEEKDSGWFKWIVFLALVLLLCAAGSYVYYKFTPNKPAAILDFACGFAL